MKWKNLVPLVAILLVLVCLVVLKQAKDKPVTLKEAVELVPFLPEGLTKADIAKLELYAGAAPDSKVVLERTPDAPDAWRIATHFNAPVDDKKISDFLDMLTKLAGERRAEAVPDGKLGEYELVDDKAFHVAGFRKDADAPAFDLLVGKQADYKQVFARIAGSNDVLVIAESPRREAGVWQEDLTSAPQPANWLDKDIASFETAKVDHLSIQTPSKKLVFNKEPVASEQPAEEPQEAEDATAEAEPETKTEPTEPETEWVLAEGGPAGDFEQAKLDTLLRAFNPLTATDIVDPDKKAEWGLEPPAFLCTIGTSDSDQDTVIEGGRPDGSGDGYIRVAGRSQEVIYKVSSYNFERLFLIGQSLSLFSLPSLSLAKDDIARVEVTQPEGNFILAKDGDAWKVVEPAVNLKTQANTLNSLRELLARWKPAGYADPTVAPGFDETGRKVVVSGGEADTAFSHTIVLGSDTPELDGAYARLDDGATTLMMSRSDIDKIFVDPSDLFQHQLLDIDEDDIASVQIDREADPLSLARTEDGGWALAVAGEPADTESLAIDSWMAAITDLQADSLLLSQAELGEPTAATLVITMKDGTIYRFSFGAANEDPRIATLSSLPVAFSLDPIDAAELLPSSDSLKKKEPEPEPEPPAVEPAPEAPADQPAEAPQAPEPEAAETAAPAEAPAVETVVELPAAPAGFDAPAEAPASTEAAEAPPAAPAAVSE